MNRLVITLSLLTILAGACSPGEGTIFIEAESFDEKGGWVTDQQFMNEMGSPYLMAHGLGDPVEDASTLVTFPGTGTYYLHVRTKNWASRWSGGEAPGQFRVLVNGEAVDKVFGMEDDHWGWIPGGAVNIDRRESTIALHDLTGFNGRCDALVFTTDPEFVPANDMDALDEFRHQMLNLPEKPKNAGDYDLVVVGGGMGGICTAISAARNGVKVALIQNRPLLGGNNSSEVRVHLGARIRQEPWPNLGNLVNEIGPEKGGNAQPETYYEDNRKLEAVLAEENITLFLNCHAEEVEMDGKEIRAVIAHDITTSEKLRFTAPLFADCTGDGTIGVLAGAGYMQGRESRDVFGEPTAPEVADDLTMGASVQWFSEKQEEASSFPDITWGLELDDRKSHALTRGDWDWETGMGVDQTKDFERVRDYGMLVVFSNWSFIKNHSAVKEQFANERLKWVAFIAGKRETRRLTGDYVLHENDLREHKVYPDGTAPTTWSMDLHYPHPENSEMFPDEPFRSIAVHINIHPYPIPYRCLYSRDVENLFMAGRHISVSHVALGTVRLMRTIGMMGEVVGMAASICKEENTLPRGVYQDHFSKLEALMDKGVGNPDLPNKQTYNLGGTLKE